MMISSAGIALAALAAPAAKPLLESSPLRRPTAIPAAPSNSSGMPQTTLDGARFSVDPALLRWSSTQVWSRRETGWPL